MKIVDLSFVEFNWSRNSFQLRSSTDTICVKTFPVCALLRAAKKQERDELICAKNLRKNQPNFKENISEKLIVSWLKHIDFEDQEKVWEEKSKGMNEDCFYYYS